MAEQKVIMTDPRQEDYFYQEAIKTLLIIPGNVL